nr:hypothetical protein [Streptomyces tsukubensis NRRL18488]
MLPFLTVAGTGISAGERHRSDGGRVSALRFASPDPLSPIRRGSGYWRYVPTPDGIRFLTGYDYRPRWGRFGGVVDRLVFRPLMGWATAWSFDRLRIWCERGISPERALLRAAAEVLGRLLAVVVAALVVGPVAVPAAVVAVLLLPPAPGTPAARRCLRTPPSPVRTPALLTALENSDDYGPHRTLPHRHGRRLRAAAPPAAAPVLRRARQRGGLHGTGGDGPGVARRLPRGHALPEALPHPRRDPQHPRAPHRPGDSLHH